MDKAYFIGSSKDFLLIYSDNKDETTFSRFNAYEVLLMAIKRLSHESVKEYNKVMHLSYSNILILIEAN